MGRTLEDYDIQSHPGVKKLKIEDGEQDDDYLKIINTRLTSYEADPVIASVVIPTIIHILDGSIVVPILLTAVNAYELSQQPIGKLKFVEVVLINVIILIMNFSKLGLPSDPMFRISLFCVIIAIIIAGNLGSLAYIVPALLSI